MKHLIFPLALAGAIALTPSCKKEAEEQAPQMTFKVVFDSTLPRLGNLGHEVNVPSGNAAQHPNMQEVSLHYIEFAQDAFTPLGQGAILYQGEETYAGGDKAVDFAAAPKAKNGEDFISIDLSTLPPGAYNWVRVSLTYQKYEIDFRLNDSVYFFNEDFKGTFASFVGYNTYLQSYRVKDSTIQVNGNRLQGFWAFETQVEYAGQWYGSISQGEGAGVTVVNPINNSSPVPPGSCVVTGSFAEPLVIGENEQEDMRIVLAFSINNSFEWTEVNVDGKWEPGAGEQVADMGLRGLHPYKE